MNITIPGALADHLADQVISDEETAAALAAGHRGRGRTLTLTPTSTRPLHVISGHAEHILSNRGAYTRAQVDAARLWIQRAGHAPAILEHRVEQAEQHLDAVEEQAAAHFRAATRAADAVEYAEQTGAAVDTVAEAEVLYAAQLVTEAELTDGTWRGEWIGQQADDGLFALEPAVEQGALFADRAAAPTVVEVALERVDTVAPEVTRASVDAYLARTYPALFTPAQPRPAELAPAHLRAERARRAAERDAEYARALEASDRVADLDGEPPF